MTDIDEVRDGVLPLSDTTDLDPLLRQVGAARCVLIGEASHGTHEYYAWRAALTRRLIAEHGFSMVAVEADWPDCRPVHRSVTLAAGAATDPAEPLRAWRTWPTWMWANRETVDFCRWLRDHNATLPPDARVGWYGMDTYAMFAAVEFTLDYLEKHCPDHIEAALSGQSRLVPEPHADTVVTRLVERHAASTPRAEGDRWQRFDAAQHAGLIAGAGPYYRALTGEPTDAWNARDVCWIELIERLLHFHGPNARAVVWAHNTHVGDARATDMSDEGVINIGQLARQRFGAAQVAAVGFAGGGGTVIAAARRGGPARQTPVPRPPPDTLDGLLAETGLPAGLFLFGGQRCPDWAIETRGHRAIGVVYTPDMDADRYVPTRAADRYDALCWLADTSAVGSLHPVDRPG